MIARRVLLTSDAVGGVWDFCITLASGLIDAGHSVTLLAIGSPTQPQRYAAELVGADLITANLKLEWMQDSAADVLATRKLVADVAREVRADLVHANQFAAGCVDVDVPVVMTVHSDVLSWRRWTLGATDVPPEWRAYRQLVSEALERADCAAAVSRFLADELHSVYGTNRAIEVIYNGWPAPIGVPGGPRAQITLAAGRIWDAAKNLALIFEAANGWDPGEVYVAGDRHHPDGGEVEIPAPCKALGLLPRHEMDYWLARASVYVSAARYDPFGLLPLQAALHGCGLLLSDIPSYRELWDGAATFFHSDDADDLRRQWRRALDQPPPDSAYRRARERYAARRMTEAYRDVYAAKARPGVPA